MAKAKKERKDHYDEKLFVKGSFEDLVKLSVTNVDKKPNYYTSKNQQRDSIDVNTIATALEYVDEEGQPYYYIKFVLKHGAKIEWRYMSKDMRDKEINEIRELKK